MSYNLTMTDKENNNHKTSTNACSKNSVFKLFLKMQCHDFFFTLKYDDQVLWLYWEKDFFQKNVQKELKLSFYVATPTSWLCMRGCQVGGSLSLVSHTPQCKVNLCGLSPACKWGVVMSQNLGFSTGPFDSEGFSFQEETKNTQGRQICTFWQHLEVY